MLKGLSIAVFFHGTHNVVATLIGPLYQWWAFQLTWHTIVLAILLWLLWRFQRVHPEAVEVDSVPSLDR